MPGVIAQNAFAKSKQSLAKESIQSFTEKRFKENESALIKTNLYNAKYEKKKIKLNLKRKIYKIL